MSDLAAPSLSWLVVKQKPDDNGQYHNNEEVNRGEGQFRYRHIDQLPNHREYCPRIKLLGVKGELGSHPSRKQSSNTQGYPSPLKIAHTVD